MIRRLLSWTRRLVGLALVAWSAWVVLRELLIGRGDPLVAADADTGELYGFQLSPLTPSQRQAALEREAVLMAVDWP